MIRSRDHPIRLILPPANGIMPCVKSARRLHPALAAVLFIALNSTATAQPISLQTLVTPSTVITKDGHPVTFALHGFIEFQSLSQLFPYIDTQTHRWPGNPAFTDTQRERLARELLRRGIESRVVSMTDERPFETLFTHTEDELRHALAQVTEPAPPGYADTFLAVQQKWKHALNCWSAAPSIPVRVLSNWYPIAEGIHLYGATYDSTEHFWQTVKYHPDVTVADLNALLTTFEQQNWPVWIARLDADPSIYLPNAYAMEFLRFNLKPDRFHWFRDQLTTHDLAATEHARAAQQRTAAPFRFTAFEEKVIWGDLADVFHLVYSFSAADDPIRPILARNHFDAIYLDNRKMPFISEGFRSLMLDIWHVKYLEMPRFREVISSIPIEIRLEHFLNDGDSPDIPIPIYVGYLNQIRKLARKH
jgi:hypothetical protein